MKETKKCHIKDKVFNIDDLKRFAKIFEEQATLARENDEHHTHNYELNFSDDTTVESEALDILENDILFNTKRPITVQFSFLNYTLNRRFTLSLNHGDASYGNTIIVSGQEREWINDIFARLTEALNGVIPQESWIKRHPTLLLNIIALGIGTLGLFLIFSAADLVLLYTDFTKHIKPPKEGGFRYTLGQFIRSNLWFCYTITWAWKLLAGYALGAFEVRRWFLDLWPSIELDLGPEHLKIEKKKRKKIYTVFCLVIIPIIATIIFDIIKFII